jgi:hypothetical protein
MTKQRNPLTLKEGELVRYWDKWSGGWRAAYFEKLEKRARLAVLIPPILGKRRIKVPIQNVRELEP